MGEMNKRKTGDRNDVTSVSLESERVAVGRLLREAREGRGLTIDDIAMTLCIRARHLQALEDGMAKELPGGPYTLGFVRAYADFLALDGVALSRRYRADAGPEQSQSRLYFPEPVPDQRTPVGAILLIGVLLASGIYGGWYYLSSHNRTMADLVSPLPEELSALLQRDSSADATTATVAAETTPPTPHAPTPSAQTGAAAEFAEVEALANDTPADSFAPPAEDDGADPAATASAATADTPANIAAVSVPAPTMSTNTASGTAIAARLVTPPAAPPAPPPIQVAAITPPVAEPAGQEGRVFGESVSGNRIVIRAVQDSWVQVRDPKGDLLISRVLRPGDQYRVPDQAGLTLVTGNAGGLEILVDGAVAPRLGRQGDVLRGVMLDAGRLVGGSAVSR